MPTFEYQAKKSDGSIENGIVVGTTLDGAARDLTTRGLSVTRIGFAQTANDPIPSDFGARAATIEAPKRTEGVERPRSFETPNVGEPLPPRTYFETSVAGPLIGRADLPSLAFFFRQAATMLKAGVGVVQTMNTLAGQSRNPNLARVLREVSREVERGNPISTALERYPEIFTDVIISVLKAGEHGGFVDSSLETIADYLDQEIELRNLYKKATFWPKLELGASVVIIVGANAIISSINDKAQKLPSPLTNPATWVVLGPILIALFLFFRIGLANPNVRSNWDFFIAKIPYLGTTLRQIAMARFGRAFAALYRAGVPLQNTLTLAANACGNEYLKSLILPASRDLEQGRGVTETLEATHAFSPIVLDMVRTGETTGNLDQMLSRSSEFYIEEAKVRQQKLGLVVGISVTILVCIYIGYIIITFYMSYGSQYTGEINSA